MHTAMGRITAIARRPTPATHLTATTAAATPHLTATATPHRTAITDRAATSAAFFRILSGWPSLLALVAVAKRMCLIGGRAPSALRAVRASRAWGPTPEQAVRCAQPGPLWSRGGALTRPRLARFVPWDIIGASRDLGPWIASLEVT